MTLVKSPQFRETEVVSQILDVVPAAKQVSNIGAEMSYILDHDSAKMFKSLFERFEGGKCVTSTLTKCNYHIEHSN